MAVSFQASQRFTRISSRPSPIFLMRQKSTARIYEFPFKLSLETGMSSVPMDNFFYLWDFTKFHLPKKISRFCFANVNALQWLLKVKIQCKFFLWLHLYLCKSSLYVHMLLLHQVGPKVNSIYIYSNSPILKEISSVLEMSFASHCSAPMDFMHCLGIWFQDYCKPFGTVTSNIIYIDR